MRLNLAVLLLLAATVLSRPLHAATLKVDTGTWEMTTHATGWAKEIVDKECVRTADVAELASGPAKDEDDDCKYVANPAIKDRTWSADRTCTSGLKVHAEFTVDDPHNVHGTIVSTPPRGGQAVTVRIRGRWLAAGCAGVE